MVKIAGFSMALVACLFGLAGAQDKPAKVDPIGQQAYIKPPKEIMDAVLAPWYLNESVTNLSPDHTRYLVTESQGMPPLARLGKPY